MITALDYIGDLRAATTDKERVRVLLSTRHLPRWDDLRAVAEGYDRNVLSVDRLAEWSAVTNAQGRTDRYEGRLTVDGVELVVPRRWTVTRRWATRPGWYVLDLWERDEWVRSEDGAPYRNAPRQCLETTDAYLRGEATMSHLRDRGDLRAAAHAASWIMRVSSHVTHVAYATSAAIDAAIYGASGASPRSIESATYAAAEFAVNAHAAEGVARAQERARWHEDWRWHLIHAALDARPSASSTQ